MSQLVTVYTEPPTSSPAVAATVSCAALAPGLGGVEAAEADQAQPQRGLGCRHGEVRGEMSPAGDHCSLQPRHPTRGGQRRIQLCSAASPRWRSPEAAAVTQTGRGEAGRLGPRLH